MFEHTYVVVDFAILHLQNLLEVPGHEDEQGLQIVLQPHGGEICDDWYPQYDPSGVISCKGHLFRFIKHNQYNSFVFSHFVLSLLVTEN
jgi:hypothetical protein